MRLRASQFASFFKALHGYDPFPWQRRLASVVLESGTWPDLLDIPTGLGKTSAIDVALFVLAASPQAAPRRTILVVDRRVVVDQAADHARKIQQRLTSATDGVLSTVANALRELWRGSVNAPPFEVTVLRGGMPRDEAWAQRPDRPIVALSTVDQVGSRLLFRGYGVSAGMAPVHAGLLGNDCLFLLDEVQLSTAFAETLLAIRQRWRHWRERADGPEGTKLVPNRWAFVRMSATPLEESTSRDTRLGLGDDDRAHTVVQQRLRAKKLAKLARPIPTTRTDADSSAQAVVDAFAKEALQHLDSGARRVAVIVNRVATARQIHEHLDRHANARADIRLLTGRMRPIDRNDTLGHPDDPSSLAGRIAAGAKRTPDQQPVIVVSTQTIEAGADFDFDAMVTECASIDALRQRFGRLDRRGELGQTDATILIRKDQVTDSSDDPVYGIALANTWSWLESNANEERVVDFGIAQFPTLPRGRDERAALCSPVQHAPILLPAHLDAWAQTNPRGEPDPDVALWLHGADHGIAEVRIVWRADIDGEALNDVSKEQSIREYASASLTFVPPSSLESISVPLPAFRAWIERQPVVEISDVEGAARDGSKRSDGGERPRQIRPFLTLTKSGAQVHRNTKWLYAEATVIVPATYGGIRYGNWNPEAAEPVRDVGDLAQLLHRARPVLRLVPQVLCPRLVGSSPETRDSEDEQHSADQNDPTHSGIDLPVAVARSAPSMPDVDDPTYSARDAVLDWLSETHDMGSKMWQRLCESLANQQRKLRVVELGESRYLAAIGPRLAREHLQSVCSTFDITSDIVNDDDDSASYIGREVTLEQHLGDVERWARAFAQNLGLHADLAEDLALAAALHDLGKADPRFQQVLHGGSAVRMAANEALLAKSSGESRDRKARKLAHERAGYPKGYRHELLSVAMLQDSKAMVRANDSELVLHLVGSHHGWCRPFAPAIDHGPSQRVELVLGDTQYTGNTAHGLAALDSGVADRYWTLTERYGWWTLAWFEALVRLADHRASEERARETKP